MSYILDALRKSDLQRQRGATPTLLAAQAATAPPRRSPIGVYALLAVLLLGIGVAIGWWRPWQDAPMPREAIVVKPDAPAANAPAPGPAAISPQPGAQSPSASALQSAPAPAEPVGAVTPPAQLPGTLRPAPAVSAKQAKPEGGVPKVSGLPRTADAQAPGSGAAPSQPASISSEPPPITMKDLPLSIRAELPAMKFTVHAWSADPERRLVGIDGRILREGDTVAPGLKLEEITRGGMIFDFKGYRFQRGVK